MEVEGELLGETNMLHGAPVGADPMGNGRLGRWWWCRFVNWEAGVGVWADRSWCDANSTEWSGVVIVVDEERRWAGASASAIHPE